MHTTTDSPAASAVRRALRPLAVAGAIGAIALIAAACSGAPTASVANLGTNATTTTTSPASGGAGNSGGGSPNGSGSGNHVQFSSTIGGVTIAFAQCMRSHGISDFPDPSSSGTVSFSGNGSSDLSPGNAKFRTAQQACAKYSPGGVPTPAEAAKRLAEALRYSQCMRAHGISDFPDPSTKGGNIAIRLSGPNSNSDLNPNNPLFQSAQKACQGILPGLKSGPTTKQLQTAAPGK